MQGDQRLRAPHRGLRAHRGRVRGKGVLHAYHAGTLFNHVVKKMLNQHLKCMPLIDSLSSCYSALGYVNLAPDRKICLPEPATKLLIDANFRDAIEYD